MSAGRPLDPAVAAEAPPAADAVRDSASRRVALIVEDDADFRDSLGLLVRREGFEVVGASSLAEARARMRERAVDVAFVDLGLPDGSGLDVVAADDPGPRPDVVVISGNATVEGAVDALRQGVLDFLVKPVDRARLRAILSNVVRTRSLRAEVSHLRDELREFGRFGLLVGRSRAMQRVYDMVSRVAPTRASVLILGESGTGKELVAETIHRMSPRAGASFLGINCGAVAPNVIESELFGHEKGSFTGADRSRQGYFEQADGGTLFLDEITEMSADLQVKLLRVLESGSVLRVGASEPVPVDVRIVAATNREPEKAVREGRLREDLFYRLNVFPILLPPLREREGDVALLATHFLSEISEREGTKRRWSDAALRRLESHAWPGNVRELRNAVERAAILSSAELIADPGIAAATGGATPSGSAPPGPATASFAVSPGEPLEEVERRLILATLRLLDGDKKEAARRLGIGLKTLYNRLSVYRAAGKLDDEVPGA